MSILYEVLYWINVAIIVVFTVALFLQIAYVLLFFLKKKHYPAAEKKNRVAILIPARNESAVIGDTVRKLLSEQNYPRELFDVYVVADNCTDNTARLAQEAGATVYERFDDDPAHHKASYALRYGFQKILEENDRYDFFIKFDADNYANADYLTKMNDAYESGVRLARPFTNSKNLLQNIFTAVSGLYYIRNSRFSCHARAALGSGQMLTGAGMMVAAEILRRAGGWDAMSTSDDAEFTMKRLIEGVEAQYVCDAIVYEDQPATLDDTFARNKRMGKGVNRIFWQYSGKSLAKFFTRPRWTNIDMVLELLFVPMALVACIWFPLYYIYDIVYSAVILNTAHLIELAETIAVIVGGAFYLPFMLQALLVVWLERDNLPDKNWKACLPAVFLFPFFMIVYAVSIACGIFGRGRWKALKRNVSPAENNAEDAAAAPEEDAPPPESKV